jgi:Fic family protein
MFDIIRNINNLNDRNTPILQKSYNEFQNELIRLDTHNSLVGSVNQLREDRISKNKVNINSIDADLMTTRRQVEIIQNRNLIKEDIIYILRTTIKFFVVRY